MKFAVKIVLFVFILFLSTPTIVSLIEKDTDTSCFYTLSEEEHSHKEIKVDFVFDTNCVVFDFLNTALELCSSLILSENLSKHDSITCGIFIPPPDLI
jgi:hypothetical protein